MYKKNPNGWRKHADFIVLDLFSLEFAYLLSYFIRHRDFKLFQIADYRGLIIVLALLDVTLRHEKKDVPFPRNVLTFFSTLHCMLHRKGVCQPR